MVKCRICSGENTRLMYDFGLVPKSGFFLKNIEDSYPRETLRFHYCLNCAGVFRENSDSKMPDYSHVDRSTARQMPEYLDEVLFGMGLNKDEFIVEVGSNDGDLMRRLKFQGATNILGIEPSKMLAQRCQENDLRVECTHLDYSSAKIIVEKYGRADVVVCRHTLEHVPNPKEFLLSINLILKDSGKLFLEVPSLAPIIDDRLNGHEFWDEHLSYFSEETLWNLMIQAGFKIQAIESKGHLDSENILCWAIKTSKADSRETVNIDVVLKGSEDFSRRWDSFKSKVLKMAQDWPQPIIGIGGSHPQSNFFNFLRLSDLVSGVIDDDSWKRGKYIPAKPPIRIGSIDEVVHPNSSGTLLLTGFGYPSWENKIISNELMSKYMIVNFSEI